MYSSYSLVQAFQVLQGALPRQYTGASIISKKSLKIRLARHFKEKSTSEIDWRVNAGHMLRHELHILLESIYHK